MKEELMNEAQKYYDDKDRRRRLTQEPMQRLETIQKLANATESDLRAAGINIKKDKDKALLMKIIGLIIARNPQENSDSIRDEAGAIFFEVIRIIEDMWLDSSDLSNDGRAKEIYRVVFSKLEEKGLNLSMGDKGVLETIIYEHHGKTKQ